jgi:predicted short-subunit dehydrogenase-like oxidoreductase (DUF2520 family)
LIKGKITIIGAGKIAYSLTPALLNAGYKIESVVSSKKSSAKNLAAKFSIKNHSDFIKDIPSDVNIFFLTVPDGEIKKVANDLSKLKRNFKETICVHFSGVEDITALNSLKLKGAATASLHIMQTFPSKNVVEITGCPAAIETQNEKAKKFLLHLCRKLRLKPFFISSDQKPFYHLAGVFSSNFLVGNIFIPSKLFNSEYPDTNEIYKSTALSTLKNIFKTSPAKALSGPIDRGDFFTIKKHVEALELKIKKSKMKNFFRLLKMNYLIQSLSLLEVAQKKYGRLNENHLKIKKFLKGKLRRG